MWEFVLTVCAFLFLGSDLAKELIMPEAVNMLWALLMAWVLVDLGKELIEFNRETENENG